MQSRPEYSVNLT